MNVMGISALGDAIKSLAQSLQVSTIFPAGLLVMLNTYFIAPLLFPDLDCTTPQAITIVISMSLLSSYTLYAFNFPLIRLFEGYKFQEDFLFSILSKWSYDREIKRFRRIGNGEGRPDRDFPSKEALFLPTKIGNVIKSFEEYPKTHYGMDSIALWSRLVPVLKDKGFLNYVSQEKTVFDFLLNMCVVTIIFGVELVYKFIYLGHVKAIPLIFLATYLVFRILYEGSYVAARQWGTVVRVAFDLYRHDLAQRLSLRPASTFREEWNRWKAVSHFFLYHKPSYASFKEFIPQSQLLQFKETVEHLDSEIGIQK